MTLRSRTSSWPAVYLLAVVLLMLSACQPAAPVNKAVPSPTTPATDATAATDAAAAPTEAMALPTAASAEAYPVEGEEAAGVLPGGDPSANDPGAGYPVGPMGMPAIENSSRLTARLIASSPDDEVAGFTRLTVLVLSAESTPGTPSFTQDLANQEVDLFAATTDLPVLTIGDDIAAEVEYRGDEHGGKFFVKTIQLMAP